jgi:hypothetical protein
MPSLAPPPYQSKTGSIQWHAWYRQINDLLEGISLSIGEIDDITLTDLGDNELLVSASGIWVNQTMTEFGIVHDTSPQLGGVLNTGSFDIQVSDSDFILDENGNELLQWVTGGGATHYLRIRNGASTTGMELSMISSASTADGHFNIKQTGAPSVDAGIALTDTANKHAWLARFVASPVNYFEVHNSAAGQPLPLTAIGTDTDIGILLQPKGAGVVDVEGAFSATGTGDIEGNAILGGTLDSEGVATFNAATHVIVGNATVEGSLLSVAETTDEWILTFNSGTETWEGQANAASAAEHDHEAAEIDDGVAVFGAAEHSHVAGEITDLTIEDNSDVTLTTLGDEELLMSASGVWINQTLTEAGISAIEHAHEAAEIDDGVAVFGAAEHSHTVGEVSGVAAAEHAHVAAEVTDLSLADNADVTIEVESADEAVLTFNAGTEVWEDQALPTMVPDIEVINDIGNVEVDVEPTDEHVLTFNAGTELWENQVSAAGATELEGLDNVTTEVMGAGQDEHVLTWNDAAEVWEDQASAAGATELEGLDNVTTEVMGVGQDGFLLAWNDTAEVWEDTAPSGHDHEAAEIDDGVAVFGAAEHSHTVGEVSGVAAAEHSHVAAEVTDLSIENLADVTVGTPSDEDALTWNDSSEVWEAQAGGGGGDKVYRQSYTWNIYGELAVAVGDTDFIGPIFIGLATGQTAELVGCRYMIGAGTEAEIKVLIDGVDATGFTELACTEIFNTTSPAAVEVTDAQDISIFVESVTGAPTNMSFTIWVDYTQ